MTVTRRAYSFLTIKAVDEERRLIRGVATTPTPDRVGDIVEPIGVKFTNPMPFLWQHFHDAPIGTVFVWVVERSRLDGRSVRTLALRIMPDWPLANALGCGTFYAEATPVESDIADLPGFLVAAEDMLAEFLADVLISPLADRYLPGAA